MDLCFVECGVERPENENEIKSEFKESDDESSDFRQLEEDSDSNMKSNPDTSIVERNEKEFAADYHKMITKSYTSVSVKQEPVEDIKTIFKESLLQFEIQKYQQQLCEDILKESNHIKLKDLQSLYINKLCEFPNIDIFTCSLCNYQTINETTLRCHFLAIHNGKTEHEIFKCSRCDYETTFPSHITRHATIHKKPLEKTGDIKKEKYPCTECSYKGRSEEGLKRHFLLHKDKTRCDLCSFESQDKDHLKQHKDTHKKEGRFHCYKCNYTNRNKLSVGLHLLNIHNITNEASKRIKICEICSKSFSNTHQLQIHYITHKTITELGENEIYKCSQCNHQTKYKANFKKHMLVHKAPEFICYNCGFATKHKQSYENHLITHKKLAEIQWFHCSVCPYKCRTKPQLKHHIRKGLHRDKNLRHIRNRDRIREAEERGEVFVPRRRKIKTDMVVENVKKRSRKSKRCKKVITDNVTSLLSNETAENASKQCK